MEAGTHYDNIYLSSQQCADNKEKKKKKKYCTKNIKYIYIYMA